MTKASTLFSKFVSSFIEKNCSEDIVELWNDETKEEFVKMIEKELKKNTKVKKEKKPADAPKGARSTYILFCMEERPKINKEFPELSNQDKVKLMAERWNEAKEDEDILKRFKKLAEDDKKRAAKDKENYVPSDGGDDEKPKKKVKRSKTGYMLFCENERAKVKKEGFTGKDITTELAKRWKDLKEEEEDMYTEYMEKAAELKKAKVEESESEDEHEEEKPKTKKAATKKVAAKKKAAPKKKKVVEESDSDSSSDEE